MLKAIATYREMLLEIGAELQEEGRLEHRDDIFMVTLEDLESGEKLQEKVKQNRWEYEKERRRASVPRIMTSTGETFYFAPPGEGDDPDKGVPVSPGYCEGTIKVLNNSRGSRKTKPGRYNGYRCHQSGLDSPVHDHWRPDHGDRRPHLPRVCCGQRIRYTGCCRSEERHNPVSRRTKSQD